MFQNVKGSTSLYVKYKIKANNSSLNCDQSSQVKIYLKLNKPEDKILYYSYLHKIDNKPTDFICINDFLVTKRFALSTADTAISYRGLEEQEEDLFHINTQKSEDKRVKNKLIQEFGSNTNLDIVDEADFYNISYLKYYLDKNSKTQSYNDSNEKKVPKIKTGEKPKREEESIIRKNNDSKSNVDGLSKIQNSTRPIQNFGLPENVLIDGFDNIEPILNIDNKRIHPSIRDYLRNRIGLRQISEFNSYCWPVIFRGRHLFGMSNEDSSSVDLAFSYLCPLLSLLLEQTENNMDFSNIFENGYVKNSMNHSLNGPKLLILCTSCKSALRIYEIIKEILDLVSKMFMFIVKTC